MIPIIHKACGKQIAWGAQKQKAYIGRRLEIYMKMDGTKLVPTDHIELFCPSCKVTVTSVKDMRVDQ